MQEAPFDYDEIRYAIENSEPNSTIYIGSDSKQYTRKGVQKVAYVTVIILHQATSKGGRIFKSLRVERDYGDMRSRLMTEVQDAITAGYELVDLIDEKNFGFEIHLDINRGEQHKSSVLVKEATGYVLGMFGFEPKLKPESFAASSVADRWAVKNAKNRKDRPADKRRFRKERYRSRKTG